MRYIKLSQKLLREVIKYNKLQDKNYIVLDETVGIMNNDLFIKIKIFDIYGKFKGEYKIIHTTFINDYWIKNKCFYKAMKNFYEILEKLENKEKK